VGLTLTLFGVVVEWGRDRFSLKSQLGDRFLTFWQLIRVSVPVKGKFIETSLSVPTL